MKLKTVYVCTECGAQSQKWLGKCPHCGKWNSLVEEVIDTSPEETRASKRTSMAGIAGENKAQKFGEMELPAYLTSVLFPISLLMQKSVITASLRRPTEWLTKLPVRLPRRFAT